MSTNSEAPKSMNFTLSYKGVNVQFTNRDEEAELKPLMEKAKKAIDWALDNEFDKEIMRSFGAKKEVEYVEGRTCPTDGGRLVKPQPGSKAPIKCENNKWNATTKSSYGCPFIEWPNNTSNVPQVPVRQVSEEDYGI